MNKQTVIITGASSGIGKSCCELLLKQAYPVIGLARTIKDDFFDDANFTAIPCDLAKPHDIELVFKRIIKKYSPSVVIHAAGFGQFGSIEQFSSQQITTLIQVNLTSNLQIARLLLPHLRSQQQAKMIYIGSESALAAGKKGSVYCASKFGLRGFVQSLRQDCAADDIAISLINPGMVDTHFFKNQTFRPAQGEKYALEAADIAKLVSQIIATDNRLVIDEINVSPAIKNIDFS